MSRDPYAPPSSEVNNLGPRAAIRWGRIMGYAATLFALRFLIHVTQGIVDDPAQSIRAQLILEAAALLAVFAAWSSLFARLVYRQVGRPLLHASLTLLSSLLLTEAINRILGIWLVADGPILLEWLQAMACVAAAIAGTAVGLWLQRRPQRHANVAPTA
ncbi:hypothetical protein ACYX7E_18360 [Luteimonas sp. RIT-PG2_3]